MIFYTEAILHRDIKPENILLDYDGQIKLVDFGLSNFYTKGQKLFTPCGSPCYVAPEVIVGQGYDGEKVDIWSCGITLYAMVCGFLPFEDPDQNKIYQLIQEGNLSFPDWVSDECT